MVKELPLLSILILLPMAGAFLLALIPAGKNQDQNVRQVTLLTTVLTFCISLILWFDFSLLRAEYQFVEYHEWLPDFGIVYHLGVDGLSLLLILLSTFLMPACILASWCIEKNVKLYMSAFLLLETFIIGAFLSVNLVLFYVFFEAVLIPMFLLIGIWGGNDRIYAALKFFLYTLFGSIVMLVGILYIFSKTGSADMQYLNTVTFSSQAQIWLWWAFFAAFSVKIPMWPVHTWLPDAHVQAPTAASVILAGVLLKMGGYGLLRFSVSWFPEASTKFAAIVFFLSITAVIYTSLVAAVQKDMKKLLAYSSVAHMGIVTVGIFTLTADGINGAMYQMLSHGIVSGALFLCVGVLSDRMHTREIKDYGGVVNVMPKYAVIFFIVILATIGVPSTSGFVGEVLVIFGAISVNFWVAGGVAMGIIFGTVYALSLYGRVVFGPFKSRSVEELQDMSAREIGTVVPLICCIVWMGVYPAPFMNIMEVYTEQLIQNVAIKMGPGGPG